MTTDTVTGGGGGRGGCGKWSVHPYLTGAAVQ